MLEALFFAWNNCVKLFFFFCPFFVLNMFLSLTEGAKTAQKRIVAIRVSYVVMVVAAISYFAGNGFLNLFGLNIEGFRIGAGILLMTMAKELAMGSDTPTASAHHRKRDLREIIVVPLGIPIIMGPACISPIIIIGAETFNNPAISLGVFIFGFVGFIVAILALGMMLYFSDNLERLFGKNVIRIFSKVSGVILMAIAAQMIARGFFAFLDTSSVGAKILEALTK